MKRFTAFFLFVGLSMTAAAGAQVSVYTALLTGGNETPNPADPDGVGFAVITVNQGVVGTVSFTVYVQNIGPVVASEIRFGVAGVTGPAVVAMTSPFVNGVSTGTVNGVPISVIGGIVTIPTAYYVNISTTDFPAGSIRGQLRHAPGTFAPTFVYLPVALKATGARGEPFVEDVRIVNRAAATANVTLDFFASNSAGLPGPTSTRTMAVAPGFQAILNDVLGTTFGTSGIGAIRVTADQDVIAEGRILDDRRATGAGTLGFFIHGLEITGVCRFGTLPVLSQASEAEVSAGIGYRTNVGYFNPNTFPVTATFNARRSSDGSSLGAVTVVIPGLTHAQSPVFSLINTVANRKQDDFYISYSVSDGPLFVYAAVSDDFTGDSYYTAGVCPAP